jgi:hypothetical protein
MKALALLVLFIAAAAVIGARDNPTTWPPPQKCMPPQADRCEKQSLWADPNKGTILATWQAPDIFTLKISYDDIWTQEVTLNGKNGRSDRYWRRGPVACGEWPQPSGPKKSVECFGDIEVTTPKMAGTNLPWVRKALEGFIAQFSNDQNATLVAKHILNPTTHN